MYSVVRIPAFNDNYLWLLKNELNLAAIVDPGDAKPVLKLLQDQNLELKEILLTHHHPDHIGGVQASAKPHFKQRVIRRGAGKGQQGGAGSDLKVGDRFTAIGRVAFIKNSC